MNRLTAILGLAYVAVIAGVIVVGPFGYPGYDSLGQHISEMGATGLDHAAPPKGRRSRFHVGGRTLATAAPPPREWRP